MSSQKRLLELSMMNVLFCMLVILIHVSSEPVSVLSKDSAAYIAVMAPQRLSSFVVQGFIFLSGLKLFLHPEREFDFIAFLIKRIKLIIAPYLLWVLLYYCYFVSIGYFPFRFGDLLRYILVGDLVAHFYFVIIIVQFYLLVPLFRVFVKKAPAAVLLLTALLITLVCSRYLPAILELVGVQNFAYNDRVFTSYLIYWTLGCLVGRHYQAFKAKVYRYRYAVTIAFVLTAAIDLVLYDLSMRRLFRFAFLDEFHILYCIAAIFFVFLITDKLAKHIGKRGVSVLGTIDRSTYHIYLCHCLFIFWLNNKMTELGLVSIGQRFIVRLVFVYILSFLMCAGWQLCKSAADRRLSRGIS